MLKGKPHLAPLKGTASVLDIGTGTGIWPIQLAGATHDRTSSTCIQASFNQARRVDLLTRSLQPSLLSSSEVLQQPRLLFVPLGYLEVRRLHLTGENLPPNCTFEWEDA